ncbi:MAG: tyrosine--tRNA ligase [Anaerolineae bacterium]|nr:tyrosine--tRNA ligase [Anaerolineae bacterium]
MTESTTLTTAERVELITRNLEEVIGRDELPALLESGTPLRHYIGLEISGRLHLGTALASMNKIRDLQQAGVHCTIFLADWHTWINDKLGGDRERIKRVAHEYFKVGLSASLAAAGGDPGQIEYILGSDLYHHNDRYWETLIDVAKNTTLSRIERSISIMGRKEGEALDFAKLIYPPMQVADIFIMGVNIAHGGIDQRKAHVIARDVANVMRVSPLRNAQGDIIKPVIIHQPMLLGLEKPKQWPVDPERLRELRTEMKMSKSRPDSAVFVNDTPDQIRAKIRKAFCPPGETDYNPVLNWARYLLFQQGRSLFVPRTPENGGNLTFATYDELAQAYKDGLHPMDLKNAVTESLIALLEPIRQAIGDVDVN